MERSGDPTKILLGYGVLKIGAVAVGLTRGGGQFTVEREYRPIQADGDKGMVKGRVVQEGSTPKLKLSALEVIGDNIPKLYPGVSSTTDTPVGSTTVTGKGKIEDTDYSDTVTWTGKTKAGKEVVITVKNAINLENIDWTLAEKDDVVAEATYTGCYLEDSPEGFEPWDIVYVN